VLVAGGAAGLSTWTSPLEGQAETKAGSKLRHRHPLGLHSPPYVAGMPRHCAAQLLPKVMPLPLPAGLLHTGRWFLPHLQVASLGSHSGLQAPRWAMATWGGWGVRGHGSAL
jgi:hypothetical protein